jgi:hypothetical protein
MPRALRQCDCEGTKEPMDSPKPAAKWSWWRIALQVLLALLTAALIYLIMLPAILMPK